VVSIIFVQTYTKKTKIYTPTDKNQGHYSSNCN